MSVDKQVSNLAAEIAQATIRTGRDAKYGFGKGRSIFIGFHKLDNGDYIRKDRIVESDSKETNPIGEVKGIYYGVNNQDKKLRAINQSKFLTFVHELFGAEAVPKPANMLDKVAMETWQKHAQELAETIVAMLDEEQMVGRGMYIDFDIKASKKFDKEGQPYTEERFISVGAEQGNDEESITLRRKTLDAEKTLP